MSNLIVSTVRALIAPLQRRVGLMLLRGTLGNIDDTQNMQSVQVQHLSDQARDDVERFQQFGFTSVPSQGAEVIVVAIGGDSDHPIAVVVDDRRYRPTGLSEGESAVYTKQNGIRVYAKQDGSLELGTSPSEFVALGGDNDQNWTKLKGAFNSWVVTPNDGGAALYALMHTLIGSGWPATTSATEVKAK